MGQRSQLYIRYGKESEKLVAYHLQWNWGNYMINRAYQLLHFIKVNNDCKGFDNMDCSCFRRDYSYSEATEALKALIQLNTTVQSYVQGHDLVKELKDYSSGYENKDSFKLDPNRQDNNDGILVIDITADKIKYGFAIGDWEKEDFIMCDADTYMNHYRISTYDYWKRACKTNEERKEVEKDIEEIEKQVKEIDKDKTFTLLTQKEYKAIFDKTYLFKDNIEGYKEVETQETIEEDLDNYIIVNDVPLF